MAQPILIKRSAVASKVPAVADLQLGELAINTYDGKVFLKKNDGTAAIIEVGPVTSVAGRQGAVVLSKSDVGLANVENKSSATIRGEITSSNVTTALGFTPLSATGGTVNGDITMAGSIVPAADIAYDLGSPTMAWRDVYIGPHSIYMNGKKILEDVSDTITFMTDVDQNLRMQTTGAGNLEIQAASQIQLKGTVSFLAGKKLLSSDGNSIVFGDSIDMDGNKVVNVGTPTALTDVATKGYVDGLTTNHTGYVRTTGDQSIDGAKTFTGAVNVQGNLTVSGTVTTVNSETISLADNIIELNSNFTTGAPTENSGIMIRRGDAGIVQFLWDEANDRFTLKDGAVTPNYLSLYTTATITAGTFVGALTGNADTATKLATVRTINGVNFDGSANISFNTDSVAEGSVNKYFTDARVRSAISSGTGISYTQATGAIALAAPTGSDIGGVKAGTNVTIAADGTLSVPLSSTTYATFNPADKGTTVTLSNGNLTATVASPDSKVRSTIGVSSGKWFWEYTIVSGLALVGISTSAASLQSAQGFDTTSYAYYNGGNKYNNGVSTAYGAAYGNGDKIGVALDMDAGTLTFYKNGVSQGVAFSGLTGTFYASVGNSGTSQTANFGQTAFSMSVPSGFNAGLFTSVNAAVTAFNGRKGDVTLASADVTSALGFTPYNATNPAGYITSAGTAANVSGTVAVANGGTGATSAEAAATNLGVSKVNPTAAKTGDVKVAAGVISIYDGSAWKQVFPAVYS